MRRVCKGCSLLCALWTELLSSDSNVEVWCGGGRVKARESGDSRLYAGPARLREGQWPGVLNNLIDSGC